MGILNPARFNPVPSVFYSDVLIRGSAGGCLKIIGKSIFIDDFLPGEQPGIFCYSSQSFCGMIMKKILPELVNISYLKVADMLITDNIYMSFMENTSRKKELPLAF